MTFPLRILTFKQYLEANNNLPDARLNPMKTRILHTMYGSILIAILIMAMQTSCDFSETSDQTVTVPLGVDGRPIGWTEQTHGNDAEPDYTEVFAQNEVKRLDITITPSDWQAMLDDMSALYGEFGQGGMGGGNGNGAPVQPADMTDACAGLDAGDTCTITFNGMSSEGTCTEDTNGQLICRSQMAPGGQPGGDVAPSMPTEMLDACADLQAGEVCTISMNGTSMEGTCAAGFNGQLVCHPQMNPGGGNGGIPGGDVGNEGIPGGNGGFGDGGGMLGQDDTNPIYVPCTLAFEGKTWWYVGLRFKGFSSLSSGWSGGNNKLPFRLDFDEFEEDYPEIDNQRFFGFQKLSLANNWSDPSYLREKVTHDIFREAGVPAPHTAFYRLYIDYGEGARYFGLYTITEIPDQPMFDSQMGGDGGNLYKPTSNWVSFNEDNFEKQSNEDEADWSDVQAAITALHADRTDAVAWRAGLEAVFDVDGFLRWLAVNTVVVNWDTYGRMAHNYYLYGDPGDGGRLRWIPWDNNMAFMTGMGGMGGGMEPGAAGGGQVGLSLSLDEIGENWPLIRYLLDDTVYRTAYVDHVRAFVENVFDVATLQARFQAEHDLIAPYVTGAEGEQAGYTTLNDPQEFVTGLDSLLQFVSDRYDAASEYLSTAQ